MHEAIRGAQGRTHALVLDPEGLADVDSTGTEALRAISTSLDGERITLALARVKTPLQTKLSQAGFGPEQFQPTGRAAVAACSGEPEPP